MRMFDNRTSAVFVILIAIAVGALMVIKGFNLNNRPARPMPDRFETNASETHVPSSKTNDRTTVKTDNVGTVVYDHGASFVMAPTSSNQPEVVPEDQVRRAMSEK